MLRFSLTGDGWIDPVTAQLNFTLVNDSHVSGDIQTRVHMVNGAWAFFKRVRVLCRGVLVEDLSSWSRLCHMLLQFAPTAYRDNLAISAGQRSSYITSESQFPIPILCGLLQQTRALPLRYMNMTIEFAICDNVADALVETSALPSGVTAQSSAWHIQDAFVTGDIMRLDSQLDNEFSSHLLKRKVLEHPAHELVHLTARGTTRLPNSTYPGAHEDQAGIPHHDGLGHTERSVPPVLS